MAISLGSAMRYFAAFFVGCLFVGIIVLVAHKSTSPKSPEISDHLSGSRMVSPSKHALYKNAAVVSDVGVCSSIGRMMLERGGNAVDAALATIICCGTGNAQSGGVGGGFVLTMYNSTSGKAHTLMARETAPAAATKNMYNTPSQSRDGGLAIGVPGEVPGYWELHQKYGSLPWRSLFLPTIELCRQGFIVTGSMRRALNTSRIQGLLRDPKYHLAEYFLFNGEIPKKGQVIRLPKLANTLRIIANRGLQGYHDLAGLIAEDIQEAGGIVTREDIVGYRPYWMEPIRVPLANINMTVLSVPPPASGAVIGSVLGIVDRLGLDQHSMDSDESETLALHRLAESFKFAFAKRSLLGDQRFINVSKVVREMTSEKFFENTARDIKRRAKVLPSLSDYGAEFFTRNDSGTSHVNVVDYQGNAVSLTSSVNTRFGSGVVSQQTGIFLNNQMDDFSSPEYKNTYGLPPSKNNFIEPGKMPQSSMAPSIILDQNNKPKLTIGASGGTIIITSIGYVASRYLYMNNSLKAAIDSRRIHHQLVPQILFLEEGFPQSYISALQQRGHETKIRKMLGYVGAIGRRNDNQLEANADYRKFGDPAGF